MRRPETEPVKALITFVERGQGKRLTRLYTEHGAALHLHCAGQGTAASELLDLLGLGTSEREVIVSLIAATSAGVLMARLADELRGTVSARGIVFTVPLTALNSLIAAAVSAQPKPNTGGGSMDNNDKNTLILVTVNHGFTDEVMATARREGARGGTVLRGRWSGTEQVEQFHGIRVQEEKEILAMVVPTARRNAILDAINAAHGLNSGANGLVCSLGIDQMVTLG